MVALGSTLALAAPLCATARGMTLRYCLADQSVPGYMDSVTFTGVAERLALDAAKRVGIQVQFIVAPRARCRLMLTHGEAEVMALAPIPENLEIANFPLNSAGLADASKALVAMNIGIVRRRGDSYFWNGQRFVGRQPALVGIRRGGLAVQNALKSSGVAIDDAATNTALLLSKVEKERIDVAGGLSADLLALLPEDTSTGTLELVEPATAVQVVLYPAVAREFHLAHRRAIEDWWQVIGQLRPRPEYSLKIPR